MYIALAQGESLLPGVEAEVEALFAADPRTAAVLLPLAPQGGSRVARAAARLMRAWDARYHHDQTYLAVGARVAFREDWTGNSEPRNANGERGGSTGKGGSGTANPVPGSLSALPFRGSPFAVRGSLHSWTAAAAAPALAFALDAGERVRSLRAPCVATPVARDLSAWLAWARAEGAAWGALSRSAPRFARDAPVRSRASWWRHNVLHANRRVGEATQALRALDPAAVYLHVLREAAWSHAYEAEATRRSRGRTPG